MKDQELIDDVCRRMIAFDQGDARRIQHFLKVHAYAALIARGEGADVRTQRIIECAALVHDIGIHPAEEKFGRCDGKLQEQEGPAPAKTLLEAAGVLEDEVARICWLVAHHHSYGHVEALDHRILVEADFLVNLYEEGVPLAAVRHAYENIFRTETGRRFCQQTFGLPESEA